LHGAYAVFTSLSVVAFVLVIGCSADGDDGANDDTTHADDDVFEDPCIDAVADGPCCYDALDTLYIGVDGTTGGEYTGVFVVWDHYHPVFRTTDGDEFEFVIDTDEQTFAELPDLSLAGELNVMQLGTCNAEDGFLNAVYFYRGEYPGELLLLVGTIGVEDLGGWTVSAPRDIATCPARPGTRCWEFEHNRMVAVSHGQNSWLLYQGEEVQTAGYSVRMILAQSGEGQNDCVGGWVEDSLNGLVLPVE